MSHKPPLYYVNKRYMVSKHAGHVLEENLIGNQWTTIPAGFPPATDASELVDGQQSIQGKKYTSLPFYFVLTLFPTINAGKRTEQQGLTADHPDSPLPNKKRSEADEFSALFFHDSSDGDKWDDEQSSDDLSNNSGMV